MTHQVVLSCRLGRSHPTERSESETELGRPTEAARVNDNDKRILKM